MKNVNHFRNERAAINRDGPRPRKLGWKASAVAMLKAKEDWSDWQGDLENEGATSQLITALRGMRRQGHAGGAA